MTKYLEKNCRKGNFSAEAPVSMLRFLDPLKLFACFQVLRMFFSSITIVALFFSPCFSSLSIAHQFASVSCFVFKTKTKVFHAQVLYPELNLKFIYIVFCSHNSSKLDLVFV